MYEFSVLLKKIREGANLTQEELAGVLEVSTVLISMIETGQKEASKNFVARLADKLGVRPSSILPFVLAGTDSDHQPSVIERNLISAGEKLQDYLIEVKSKKLGQYAYKA